MLDGISFQHDNLSGTVTESIMVKISDSDDLRKVLPVSVPINDEDRKHRIRCTSATLDCEQVDTMPSSCKQFCKRLFFGEGISEHAHIVYFCMRYSAGSSVQGTLAKIWHLM